MHKNRANEAGGIFADILPLVIKGAQVDFLAVHQVTQLQFITMMSIFYAGRCAMSELARNMKMSYPQATQIVERLIRLELVQREYSEEDRRVVYVSLTARGRDLILRFKDMVKKRWSEVLGCLSEKELDWFIRILNKIFESVGAR